MVRALVIVAALAAVAEPSAQQRRTGSALKPGQAFTECRNCPEMVVVPS